MQMDVMIFLKGLFFLPGIGLSQGITLFIVQVQGVAKWKRPEGRKGLQYRYKYF
jgi:hypothetical protein